MTYIVSLRERPTGRMLTVPVDSDFPPDKALALFRDKLELDQVDEYEVVDVSLAQPGEVAETGEPECCGFCAATRPLIPAPAPWGRLCSVCLSMLAVVGTSRYWQDAQNAEESEREFRRAVGEGEDA